jgi:hypothetical protein
MTNFKQDFFDNKKKLDDEIKELEISFTHVVQLIKAKNNNIRYKELSIEDCSANNPELVRKLQAEIEDLKNHIKDLTSQKQKLKCQLQEKKDELETYLKQQQKEGTAKEELSEEEKKKKDEDEQKFKEKQQESIKQEKEQYKSAFSGFNELYEEFKEFNQRKETKEYVNDKPENIIAKSLLQDEDTVKSRLKTTILYVVTFFPKISSRDFEHIVLFLLEEQKVPVTVTSKITTEKGEIQLIETPEEKQLTQVWQSSLDKRDKLLEECFIKAVRSEDGLKIIDFSFYYLRNDLRTCLEEEYALYVENQFKRSKFLLFDYVSRVVINAIDLSVEMALSNPDAYGQSWLCSILGLLKILEFADILANDNDSNMSLEEWLQILLLELETEQRNELSLFNKCLKLVGKKQRRQFVFLRLSVLISQMLAYAQLKDEVESFLNWAIREQHQDAVLEIIKPLQKLQNFNQLYWIKELLDQGNGEIREKAYIFLSSRLEQSTSLIYDKLEYIKNWLPAPESPLVNPSNEYALRLLFEYAFEKLSELEPKDYGNYPSKYPLFKPLDGSSDDDSKLRLLVDWIFNPGLRYIINPDITTIQVTGSLISDWFNILWGLGNKEAKPEAANIIDNLVKQIKAATDRNQQKDLIQFWNDLSEDLLNQAELASEAGEEQLRKLLIQKRNLVRQLKKQFQIS